VRCLPFLGRPVSFRGPDAVWGCEHRAALRIARHVALVCLAELLRLVRERLPRGGLRRCVRTSTPLRTREHGRVRKGVLAAELHPPVWRHTRVREARREHARCPAVHP
jgi:hypothetical protein